MPSASAVTPIEAIVAFLDRLRAKFGTRESDRVASLQEAPPFEPGPIRLPLVKVERPPPPVAKEDPSPVSAEQLARLIREGVSDVLADREEPIGAAVASGSQSPLSSPAAVGLLDAAIGTAAPSLLTVLGPGLLAATGVGIPAAGGIMLAVKYLPALYRWRRRRKTMSTAARLAGIAGTQPHREPPKASPVVPVTTGESQTVTEESPSPEAVYNINYRPQPVDPGLLRMRRAFQRTSDEYPAAMPWVKRFEKVYELLLSGERK